MKLSLSDVQIGGYWYGSSMTPELYNLTNFFKNYTKEKWGDYRFIKVPVVYWLDELRDMAGSAVNIHCAYEYRKSGYHPVGMAVDLHITGLSVSDQFILATKLPFGGIGAYPHWNQGGLHVDIRYPWDGKKRYWYRDSKERYHNLKSMKQISD